MVKSQGILPPDYIVLNDLTLHEFSYNVAQWIERLPGVWEVIGSIPIGDSGGCRQFTFHISLPSLKLTILDSVIKVFIISFKF